MTSLPSRQLGARYIYERTNCARGDTENRIKEQQLELFADRTSTATMYANQLRLYFSSVAYMMMETHAPDRVERHRSGQGPVQHDSFEATQNRRPGSGHGTPGVVPYGERLSLCRRVRAGLRQHSELSSDALLNPLTLYNGPLNSEGQVSSELRFPTADPKNSHFFATHCLGLALSNLI